MATTGGRSFVVRIQVVVAEEARSAVRDVLRFMMRWPVLMREYVEHALYARGRGYFAQKHVVGGLRAPLPFHSMVNETDYRDQLLGAWESGEAGSAWLTPSEMFTPYYGTAVAKSIVERHKNTYPAGTPLQMVEVGGGNGTCACDILRFLKHEEPEMFSSCKYLLVEISPALAEVQHARLATEIGDAARFEVVNEDARLWAEGVVRSGQTLSGPWWINLFEVLDNLGHDLVRVSDLADGESECLEMRVGPNESLVEDAEAAARAVAEFESAMAEARGDKPVERAAGAASGGAGAAAGAGPEGAEDPGADNPLRDIHWLQTHEPMRDPDLVELMTLLDLRSASDLEDVQAAMAETEGAAPGSSAAFAAQQLFGGMLGLRPDVADAFIPTGSWRLLKALCRAMPQHQFTIADYSWLPQQPEGAINHPVVQMQMKGRTIDLRGQYLMAAGEADIMFPTNFAHLTAMVEGASARSRSGGLEGEDAGGEDAGGEDAGGEDARSSLEAVHMPSADFMRRWHDGAATQTKSGFNPLVDDFTNTAFALTGKGAHHTHRD